MGTLVKEKKAQSTASHSKRSKSGKCILALLMVIITVCAFLPAAYAVDIQFGVTTTGNTDYPTSTFGTVDAPSTNSAAGAAKNLIATKYTLSVPATITKIGGYALTAGHWKLGIYSNNKGGAREVPGTLLASNQENNVVHKGDNSFSIGPIHLDPGTYWIAIISDTDGTRKYLAGGTLESVQNYGYDKDLPLTFPSSTNYGNNYFAYCTYVQLEGCAKATKVTLADNNVQLKSVSFYSHSTGNYRIAIYDGATGPNQLKWQSGDTPATTGWNTITITAGSPASLTLTSGTYWIVYQWNSPNLGPSYTSSSDAGNSATLSYGTFPASWTGGTASSEQWSVYATYSFLTPSVLPETPVGALLAVVLCFGAFAVFVKTQKVRAKNFASAAAKGYVF